MFALLVLFVAIAELIDGLASIDKYNFLPINPYTGQALSRDGKIVYLSAHFTILCIPILAIWLFGSKAARWIIAALVLFGLVNSLDFWNERYLNLLLEGHPGVIFNLALRALGWIAVGLLFLPPSHRWLHRERMADPETFA